MRLKVGHQLGPRAGEAQWLFESVRKNNKAECVIRSIWAQKYPFTHYLRVRSSRECVPLPEHVQKRWVVGSNTVPSFSSEMKVRGAGFPTEARGNEVEEEGKSHIFRVCPCDKHGGPEERVQWSIF